MQTLTEWCHTQGCTHAHCPICDDPDMGREHPQPFLDAQGRLLCGTCWWQDRQEVLMRPCAPGQCPHIAPESPPCP